MTKHTTINALEFARELMSKRSVSGEADEGALDLLQAALEGLGFECTRLPFSNPKSYPVDNLYAIREGNNGKHLGFAGHTDVVPPGPEANWSVPPFEPAVVRNMLFGRGAVDMKAAIAAWVAAISEASTENTLSLIITGDEEAEAINGTDQMVDWVEKNNLVPDGCVVGEPTNPQKLGEMIKVGRRGSLTFDLTVNGTQGHVAYPESADNPITPMVAVLDRLINTPFDAGSGPFPPSHLEVTTVDVGNPAGNVIPGKATAKFNVRFNDKWTRESIKAWVKAQIEEVTGDYELTHQRGSEAFFTPEGELSDCVAAAVQVVTGKDPARTTSGGTSDARFIRRICPVVECGLINATAHQIDERVEVKALEDLTRIYTHIIETF